MYGFFDIVFLGVPRWLPESIIIHTAERPVQVNGNDRAWSVDSKAGLDAALSWRDRRGGAVFWMSHASEFPCLGIRVSGDAADVHYIPEDGHPGFRCLGGEGLPAGGFTTLVYDGCDPATGEVTPNEFVVPFETVRAIVGDFFANPQMSDAVSWFEL